MVSKGLLLSGILLILAQGLRGTALAEVNQHRVRSISSAAQPFGQASVDQARSGNPYPSRLSNLILPLPPLALPDLLLPPYNFPSFNSERLDQELQLYLQYLRMHGKPDILVVGSSRSLQGIDPSALEEGLAARGLSDLKVYNFGINGATAQVINVLLQDILTPEQLPSLIIWGDGTRAFNSGRPDQTYRKILASAGYQRILKGERPIPSRTTDWEIPTFVTMASKSLAESAAVAADDPIATDLSDQGFQTVTDTYNPNTYYQEFPWVPGQYDGDYQNFNLQGEQTEATIAVARFARTHNIKLILVSLPLTRDYIDSVRRNYESRFQQRMWQLASQEQFMFRNLSQQPELMNNGYFADPSHINHHGARAVALHLAADSTLPWQVVRPASPP